MEEHVTEEQALVRVTEIGQAFAHDLNDGDSEVLYEGLSVHWVEGGALLTYTATLEDDIDVEYRWMLLPVEGRVYAG